MSGIAFRIMRGIKGLERPGASEGTRGALTKLGRPACSGERHVRSGEFWLGAFLILVLPGCAALPGGGPKPLDTYQLSAPSPETRHHRSRTQILIAEPSALKALDGENIVIQPAPGVIQFLKGAQWADRLPKIVQARLAEAFQRSGSFGGVGRPGEGLAIDYQVLAEIRAFQVRVDRTDNAEVEIFVKILNDRNGVVRASRTFEASVPVAGAGSNDAYIRALDVAFGDVATDIVRWSTSVI
jgi:cholesterol transport system auxiliary component